MIEGSWFELRLYASQELLNLAHTNPIETAKILFRIKREAILTILDKHDIGEFIILDEISSGFILLRIRQNSS